MATKKQPVQLTPVQLATRSNSWMNYTMFFTLPGLSYALGSDIVKIGFGSNNHAETMQALCPKGTVLLYATEGGFKTKREAKAVKTYRVVRGTNTVVNA